LTAHIGGPELEDLLNFVDRLRRDLLKPLLGSLLQLLLVPLGAGVLLKAIESALEHPNSKLGLELEDGFPFIQKSRPLKKDCVLELEF
jgi:hypothetical protein